MDWTKAKTILIVALVITNVFLIMLYVVVNSENQLSEDSLHEDTIAILSTKQIYVKGNLPSNHQKMPVLFVEHSKSDEDLIEKKMQEQKPSPEEFVTEEGAQKICEEFLRDCGYWDSNIVFHKIERDGSGFKIFYRNEYEGYLLEESRIVCTLDNGVINNMERFWFKPLRFGKSKKATISASAALIDMIKERNGAEAVTVESMEMVYWLDSANYGGEPAIKDTALPAWRITYNGGSVKYIPAYCE